MSGNGLRDFLKGLYLHGRRWNVSSRSGMGFGYMLNDFNNIKKMQNASVPKFNAIFQKGMYKLFHVIQLDNKVCLKTYFNAFDSKIGYHLRDKDPRTLKDSFRFAVNIENNMRIFGKLGNKRDDPRFFGGRNNKKEKGKPIGGQKKEGKKWTKSLMPLKTLRYH